MTHKPQKLELTWIGKDEQPRLEPHLETKTVLKKPKRATRIIPLFDRDDRS